MSKDARNSLIVWGVVLALFGSFWLDRVFPSLPKPPRWYQWASLALVTILIVWRFTRGIRGRLIAKARG